MATLIKLKARQRLIKVFKAGNIFLGNLERPIFPKIRTVKFDKDTETITITFTLPTGLNPDILKKNYYAFQQVFGKTIEMQGEIKTYTLTVYESANSKELLYNFKEILPFIEQYRLGIICGKERNGHYIAFDLLERPHILIAGETGSGKSTQLRSILTTLIMSKKPSELQMYLGDCKRQEFHIFRKVEHVQCVHSNAQDIRFMLQKIRTEMERRSKLTEVFEVGHVDDLPEEYRVPYIVVCIDEFVMLRKDEEIMEILTEVVAIGRTLGTLAILSMQRPNAKVLDITIRANLTVSMGFKLRDVMESKIVNTPKAHEIETSGRFIMNSDKLYEIQAPYLLMNEAKILLSPYMVTKGKVKDVTTEKSSSKQLREEDVFNDVD